MTTQQLNSQAQAGRGGNPRRYGLGTLLGLALVPSACGNIDGTYVAVTLSEAAAPTLRVQAALNNTVLPEPPTYDGAGTQLVLKLPPDQKGDLLVDVTGLGNDGCILARGSASTNLLPNQINELPILFKGPGYASCPIQSPRIYRLWGTDSNNIWAAALGGVLLHYDGTGWHQPESSKALGKTHLLGLWGSASGDMYIAGGGGNVFRKEGPGWERMTTSSTQSLTAIGGRVGELWAVGFSGTILRLEGTLWKDKAADGTSWTPPDINKANLWDLATAPDGKVWAVGDQGIVIRFEPGMGKWVREDLGTTKWHNSIHATTRDAWMAGAGASLYRMQGNRWVKQELATPYSGDFYSVYAADAKNLWIGADEGTVLHCTIGPSPLPCEQKSLGQAFDAQGIWASERGSAWFAGGAPPVGGKESDPLVGVIYRL